MLSSRRGRTSLVRSRRLPVATYVDSRLFRGFSSRHFRLALFVRFKGNLARPEAIRPEGGFEFRPPPPSDAREGSRFNPPPYPKSVSSRKIEGAAQRRSDNPHRSSGKVDPGFASFERARDTLYRARQLYLANRALTSGTRSPSARGSMLRK